MASNVWIGNFNQMIFEEFSSNIVHPKLENNILAAMKAETLPLVIWGAGSMSYSVRKILKRNGIPITACWIDHAKSTDVDGIPVMSIDKIIEKYGMKQQELADKLGVSRSGIANTMRILNLDERVIDLVLQGNLTEGHCRSLLTIEDKEKQYQAALYIIETGDSVREVEKQMRIKKKAGNKGESRYEPIYREIEDSFRDFFGSKVKLNAGKRSGKIVIQYSSNDELNRILDKIK